MDLAYLDAGSGSMLAAAVVAGFSGVMVAVKVGWRRMTGKFRRTSAEETDASQSADGTPAAEGAEHSERMDAQASAGQPSAERPEAQPSADPDGESAETASPADRRQ